MFMYLKLNYGQIANNSENGTYDVELIVHKVQMQGKLFQRCTHFLYCSVLSLGGKVNTRRIPQPDMGSIFTKKKL